MRKILEESARENLKHISAITEMEEKFDMLKQELKRTRVISDNLVQENGALRMWKQLHGMTPR